MLIHNAQVTGSMHLNGMDMSSITGSLSERTFNLYSASINEFTGSADSRLDSLETTSGSLLTASGSFSTRVTSLESFSSSLDATFATDAQLSGVSESLAGRLTTDESNITNNSSSFASRLTTDESNISSLQTASGSFSTRVSSNESNITSLQTASGSFSTRTTNLETASGSFSTRTTNLETASGSFSTRVTNAEGNITSLNLKTGSLATTGSNTFNGSQTITGSLFVTENLTVLGSSSISYVSQSTLNIGTNLITVNAQNPTTRFGGLAVIDSGSAPQVSGSWLFDSIQNRWIMIHEQAEGNALTSSIALMGPETYNNLGSETTISTNRLIKGYPGASGEHVGDSNISDNGSVVSINSNTQVTGSLTVNGVNTVLENRTLTINDTTYDLSANRSWTIAAGVTSFNTRTGAITLTSGDVTTALGYTPVTNARTLTINGTAYDLSADRSWTIAAGVSSVSAGTGISVSGTGNVTVTNTGLLSAVAGSGISVSTVSGTLTVTNTGILSGVAGSGISVSTSSGTLTITNTGLLSGVAGSGISVSTSSGALTITNTGLLSGVAGSGISVSTSSGALTITNTGLLSGVAGSGISVSTSSGALTITNTGVTSLTAGSGISLSASTGGVTVTNTITNNNQLTNGAGYITGLSFDGLSSKTGGTGTYQTSGDFRAPIFYDSNSTAYYLDPASTSYLYTVGSFYLKNNYGIATDHTYGIYFSNDMDSGYGIYRESGAWSSPFPDLRIAFHTGIKLGANATYNGIRFYDDYTMATQVMSVNNSSEGLGANNVYVNNSLVAGSSLRTPIFYDSNDTSYYIDGNGTSRLINLWLRGAGQYDGYLYVGGTSAGDRLNINFDQVWTATGNLHFQYSSAGNIDMNQGGGYTFSRTSLRAPIFYDYNDTGYYLDPAGTSIMLATYIGGHYYYTNNTSNVMIRTAANSSAAGLVLQNSGGTFKLQLYGEGANYGFLTDTWAAWDIRKNNGGPLYLNNQSTYYYDDDVTYVYRVYGTADMRSPIYYDLDDTGYYLDPNSTSNLSRLIVNNASAGAALLVGSDSTSRVYNDNDRKGLVINAPYYPMLYINSNSNANNTTHGPVISMTGNLTAGGYRRWGMGIANTDPSNFSIGWYDNDTNAHYGVGVGWSAYGNGVARFWIDTSGNTHTQTSFQAPIFYDLNNTGYYLDPTSTTSLRTVGSWRSDSSSWDGEFSGKIQYHSSHWYIQAADLLIYRNAGGSNVFTVNQSGVAIATGDMRAPIFYDQNDTSYYLNPAGASYLYSLQLSGNQYFRPNTWIQMDGVYVMYWPNNYGLHIYPNNDGSYGAMQINGAKNGWSGIYFNNSGDHLMANNNEVGHYQVSVGWKFRWYQGTMYVSRGTTGGSTEYTVLDSGNYSGYSSFGGAVYGTIFYDANDTGYYFDPNGTSRQYQAISFGDSSRYSAVSGTINGSGAGDKLILYGGVSNYDARVLVGTDYDFIFKSQGQPAGKGMFRFYSGPSVNLALEVRANQDVWVGGYLYVNGAGTSSSIYMQDTDEGLREIHCNSNRIGFLTQAGSWGAWLYDGADWEAASSSRAPIFYDSNNTGYYLDPASTSVLNAVRFGTSTNNGTIYGRDTWGVTVQTDAGYIWLGPANSGHAHIYTDRPNFYFNTQLTVNDGSQINTSDIRANIFYDKQDTGYYCDPNGNSRFYGLYCSQQTYSHSYPGILQLGSTSYNYNFLNGSWAGSITAGILANCADQWEMAIHDNGERVVSPFLFVGGGSNYIEMGRDIGWGTTFIMAASSFRAPIFYDRNDTSYYFDGASTSRLNVSVTNTSYFGADTNKGYAQGFNTYSTSLHKIAYISFDWDSNYNAYSNHGIASTDLNGSFTDNMSINSYNDIILRIDSNANNGSSYVRYMNDTTGNNQFAYIGYNGSSYEAYFTGTGYFTGDVIAYYSDKRLKTDIKPIDSALDKLLQIGGYYYRPNEIALSQKNGEKDEQKIGLLAQEVLEVFPEVVTKAPFDMDENGMSKSGEDYLTVKYERLIPVLVEAIKEQQSQIDELKSIINGLTK